MFIYFVKYIDYIFFFKVNHKETEIYEIRSASNDVVVEGNIMVKENELYINLNSVMLNNVYNDEKTFCSDFTLYNNDKLVISINDINTCVVFDGDEPKELSEMVYNDVRIFHQITALDKKDMNFKLELNYIDGNETKKDYHYSDKIRKIIKEIYKGAYKRNKCDILDKCI